MIKYYIDPPSVSKEFLEYYNSNKEDYSKSDTIIKLAYIDIGKNLINTANIRNLLYIYHLPILALIDRYIKYLPTYMDRQDIYIDLLNKTIGIVKCVNYDRTDNVYLYIRCSLENHLKNIICHLGRNKRHKINTSSISINNDAYDIINLMESNISVVNDINTVEYHNSLRKLVVDIIDNYIDNFDIKSNGKLKGRNHIANKPKIKEALLQYYINELDYMVIAKIVGMKKKWVDNLVYHFKVWLHKKYLAGELNKNLELLN
jgi:hypothetical protein